MMEKLKSIFKYFTDVEVYSETVFESMECGYDEDEEEISKTQDAGIGTEDIKVGAVELSHLLDMFQFSTPADWFLFLSGVIFAAIHGACFPIMAVLFSNFSATFIDQISGQSNTTFAPSQSNHSTRPAVNFTAKLKPSMEDIFGSIGGSLGLSGTGSAGKLMTDEEYVSHAIVLTVYFACVALVVFLSSFIQTLCWESAATNQVFRIRQMFLYQVLRQEICWLEKRPTGYLIVKLADDIERMREGMGHKFGDVIQYSASFGVGVFFALCTNWKLALVFGSSVPFIIAQIVYLLEVLVKKSMEQQETYGKIGSIASEVLADVRTVAAFGTEKREHCKYFDKSESGVKTAKEKFRTVGFYTGLLFFLIYGSFALGFWYTCNQLAQNEVYPAEVFTVLFCVSVGVVALVNILPFVPDIANAYGCSKTVTDIMTTVPLIDPYSKDGRRLYFNDGKIELSNVTFSYPSRLKNTVLRGISMVFPPGQTVAITGTIGAGKSTIAKLLLRFYDPNSGIIKFDNVDLKHLNVSWLREEIAYVYEQPAFEDAPILDNLRSGRSEIQIPMEKVLEFTKVTGAHEFIMKLPKDYNTVVGTSLQLSTGERQLIALTRALLREPKVLILDEALTGLDSMTARKIYKDMQKLREECVTIIITSQVLRVRDADKIFLIVDGEIKEEGSHEQLMDTRGIYAEMVARAEANVVMEEEDDAEDETTWHFGDADREIPQNSSSELQEDCPVCVDEDIDSFTEQEQTSPWSTIPELMHQEKMGRVLVFGFLGCGICAGVTVGFALVFSQMLTTFAKETDGKLLVDVLWLVGFLILVGIAASAGYYLRTYYVNLVGVVLTGCLQRICYSSILRQHISWFDESIHSSNRLFVQLASNTPYFRIAIGSGLASAVTSLLAVIFGLIFCIIMVWEFVIIVVLAAAMLGACMHYGFDSYEKINADIANKLEESLAFAAMTIQNVRVVQALSLQSKVLRRYTQMITAAHHLRQQQCVSLAITIGLCNSWAIMILMAAFGFGTYLIAYHMMAPSILFTVFIVLAFCVFTTSHVIAFTPEFLKARAACCNYQYFANLEPEIDAFDKEGQMPSSLLPIVFDNVWFSYPQRPDKWILRGVSFKLEEGVCLGIIGGEGKSTVLHLLEKFYEPDAGLITLGGVNISDLNLSYLRRNIGLVPQEPKLFNRSIYENITYGSDPSTATEAEVECNRFTKKMILENLTDEVLRMNSWHLPHGLRTIVGEFGDQLTGAQKQLIAFARAFVRLPQVHLFDEPTSSLGGEEEELILNCITGGLTSIIVSDNPTVIDKANMIAVLDNGQIVEFGTPEELNALMGYYYKFMRTGVIK